MKKDPSFKAAISSNRYEKPIGAIGDPSFKAKLNKKL